MTVLTTDQVIEPLSQTFILNDSISLAGMRAKLYFHNKPSGNFRFTFYQSGKKLHTYSFTSQKAFDAIKATKSWYFWCDLALDGFCNLPRGEVELRLEFDGYVFSESAWIGWCKDFTGYDGKMTNTAQDYTEYPYMFTLIEYREREF